MTAAKEKEFSVDRVQGKVLYQGKATSYNKVVKAALRYKKNFQAVDFEGVRLKRLRFENVNLDFASFKNSTFSECVFVDCSFESADFSLCRFYDCAFSGNEFSKAKFYRTLPKGCWFEHNDFSGTNICGLAFFKGRLREGNKITESQMPQLCKALKIKIKKEVKDND